jgi:ABC-2 type transport system permease protein
MKNTKLKKIKSILIYFVILGIAYILTLVNFRLDLTSEGRYTLSDYTKNLLEKLDDDIYIKIYLDGKDLPINLKKLQQAIKEELDEFDAYSGSNFEYEFINPSENPDKNVRYGIYNMLREKGLSPIEIYENADAGSSSQKIVFPAAIISFKGKSIGINLLKSNQDSAPESEMNINNSIQSLEYEFTNALQKLTKPEKPEIAFIEGQNELSEIQVMDISAVLSEYYMVKRGKIGGKIGILDSFKAIIVAKPLGKFSEPDKFVIDQYIMNGGKVLWLLEGADVNLDSLFMTANTMALEMDNNLGDMIFSYGIRINNNLIQDKFSSPIGIAKKAENEQLKIDLYKWTYFPLIVTDNNHTISKYLNNIKTEFVSSIDIVGNNSGTKKTVLLHTTNNSLKEDVPAKISLDMINFMANDRRLIQPAKNIAVLVEGNFSSNFINRPISKFTENKNYKFVSKSKPSKMIFVSDGDIIKNEVAQNGQPYPIGFDKYSQLTFDGNKEFILNAVNYLCDDEGLMTIRSRELKMRLLNSKISKENRLLIQIINVIMPIILIILFGIFIKFFRKIKYTKN